MNSATSRDPMVRFIEGLRKKQGCKRKHSDNDEESLNCSDAFADCVSTYSSDNEDEVTDREVEKQRAKKRRKLPAFMGPIVSTDRTREYWFNLVDARADTSLAPIVDRYDFVHVQLWNRKKKAKGKGHARDLCFAASFKSTSIDAKRDRPSKSVVKEMLENGYCMQWRALCYDAATNRMEERPIFRGKKSMMQFGYTL